MVYSDQRFLFPVIFKIIPYTNFFNNKQDSVFFLVKFK
jgi:hypothetical protein